MRESGCAGVLVGIESLDPSNLRQIEKSWNTVGIGYSEALAIARDHGIAIVGSFILGMDEDTPGSLDRMLELAVEQRLFAVLFNLLTPYPGTGLYETFRREGRLTRPEWWNDPGYTYGSLVFEPRGMSASALSRKRLEMYRAFYGVPSLVRRLCEPRANARDLWHAFTFLAMNLPANREEVMRFGRALGADEASALG
jgi:radical SAM superfamily enzyme YgiQ (UPF0313 family)